MRSHLVMLSFVFCASLFALEALAQDQNAVVATVGNKKITRGEFDKRYAEIRKQAINPPPKDKFLEDLVRYEVGVQEAEKRNLSQDPQVAERLRQELYKALVEKDLADKVNGIQISDDEMKAYYKDSPEIRTSHILIELKPNANEQEKAAAKKRAQEILSEVKASKRPFEELVNLYTDDITTKKNGGDVGYQTSLTVVPAYYETALKMKVGDVSGLIETPYGYHIIKVTGRHSFDEANKRQVRAAVFEKKRLAVFNQYFEGLKKKYSINVNQSALK